MPRSRIHNAWQMGTHARQFASGRGASPNPPAHASRKGVTWASVLFWQGP